METPSNKESAAIQDSLSALRISDNIPVDPPDEPNPWQDPSPETSINLLDVSSTNTVNLNAETVAQRSESGAIVPNPFDGGAVAILGDSAEGERRKKELLEEFDPLVNQEEKAAREAWESTEGHSLPPHPPVPSPPSIGEEGGVLLPGSSASEATLAETQPPIPPAKDIDEDKGPSGGTTTTAITATAAAVTTEAGAPPDLPPRPPSPPKVAFPALAALAKTFSLPLGNRTRPRSLDLAASVPSPATLSSFASQQQLPPLSSKSGAGSPDRVVTPGIPVNGPVGDGSGGGGAGTSTPGRGSRPSSRGGQDGTDAAPPFDFQKFLDQMKLKGADPVAKYLRSFLSNFAKRTFTVNDQVKLINDFLNFIAQRMRESDIWRNATDAEFDNAMEGMEKLVMNRLYEFTFTPQIARAVPPRPVTADDLERDRVLSQRIALFTWIEPRHLDVPEGEGSEGFLMFGQQELLKINHYKAPRDKLICILNCCKVIFGLIRHLRKEEGADNFVPILIYVVLKANPEHLLSNVEFINRFRNPDKLQSEAGYYLSSLMGAVSFIETMDHTSLSNITQEEFEKNVEEAIQSLPSTESHSPDSTTPSSPIIRSSYPQSSSLSISVPPSSHTGEESAQPLALPTPTPAQTISEDARKFLQKTGDTISKPLSAIGRIFNEVLDNAEESFASLPTPFGESQPYPNPSTPATYPYGEGGAGQGPVVQTPYKPRIRRNPSTGSVQSGFGFTSPGYEDTPTRHRASLSVPYTNQALSMGPSQNASRLQAPRIASLVQSDRDLYPSQYLTPQQQQQMYDTGTGLSRTPTPNLDLAGLQQEIDRAHENAASAAMDTLRQIFPGMDQEIVGWVLEANEGDLGKSIEALLEMSSGS